MDDLEFDRSTPLKVKSSGAIRLPIYDFLSISYGNHVVQASVIRCPFRPSVRFLDQALWPPYSRYKVVENWKCTQWRQDDLNHLRVKTTLYTLETHHRGPISLRCTLWPPIFEIQGCWKLEMYRMTSEWPLPLNCLYTLNTHPDAQISIRFALRQAIFEIQVVKNRKCTEWPQNDLNHIPDKSYLYTLNTYPRGPNFTPFCSTVARFPDNRSFWFPHIGYNGEF